MSHVFISYVREDSAVVDRLASELRSSGIKVWLDRERIRPGERWKQALRRAIREGGFFLACFSNRYASRSRSYMNEELVLAIEELRTRPTERVWFIPVLLSDCDPPYRDIGAGETLQDLHWLDLSKNWKAAVDSLIATVRPRPLSAPSASDEHLMADIATGKHVQMAVEDLGGRSATPDSQASTIADAKKKTEVAWSCFEEAHFDQAAQLFEESAILAARAGDIDLERQARSKAVSAWGEHFVETRLGQGERKHVLLKIEQHVRVLETLVENSAAIALERARLAMFRHDASAALELARTALNSAQEGSPTWLNLLITCIQAHWQLGHPEDALQFADLVKRAQSSEAHEDSPVVIAATWLRTLSQAGKATPNDIDEFCGLVRDRVRDYPTIRKRALLIVGQVAREFNQPETQNETLALLEFACELSEGYVEPIMCSTIALQAAEMAGYVRDPDKARLYLGKAGAWIDKAKPSGSTTREQRSQWPNLHASWLATKGRILIRLAEHAATGDQSTEEVFNEAFIVLKEAQKLVHDHRAELWGDIEPFLAEINYWCGLAASHLNRFDEAVEFFRAVWSEPAMVHPGFYAAVGMPARLQGSQALMLAGRIEEAGKVVDALLADSRVTDAVRRDAEALQGYINRRLRPMVEWFGSPEAQAIAEESKQVSLREAVARQLAPLVAWWTRWHGIAGTSEEPGQLPKSLLEAKSGEIESLVLDFWGRGGFSRLAAAIRAKSHAVIAVEARSITDISRWARILCPIFDTVIVKWKGEMGQGMVIIPVHESLGGPGSFGGHGYAITLGSRLEGHPDWTVAVAWANPLPAEVSAFLIREALPLLASGRLVVIPAPLVGCTQSAVGWTDNLLVDNFLGGVVDVVRRPSDVSAERVGPQRVLDLSNISIPYIEKISLGDMARVLDETEEWVLQLRSLLLKSILSKDLRYERWESISALENEIRDACRELHTHFELLARRSKWHIADAEGTLSAASHGGSILGHEPVSDLLRTVASRRRELAPWIPYWRMRSFGGRLDWSCPIDNPSKPPLQPAEPQELHSWLYPGTGGWRIPTVGVP
jgi:hypothetical protein